MKEIKLTQGKVALVDDEDYEWLSQWKWTCAISGQIYRAYRQDHKGHGYGKTFFMHREILKAPVGMDVDHIDGNGLNNQRSNLRICTRQQNLMNKRKQPNLSSRYKGVYWSKSKKRWCVEIKINRNKKYLGTFKDETDAARCYNAAARKMFGEYAWINPVE